MMTQAINRYDVEGLLMDAGRLDLLQFVDGLGDGTQVWVEWDCLIIERADVHFVGRMDSAVFEVRYGGGPDAMRSHLITRTSSIRHAWSLWKSLTGTIESHRKARVEVGDGPALESHYIAEALEVTA